MLNAYEMYVLEWVADQDPKELRQMAREDADASAKILGQAKATGLKMQAARAIIGRSAVQRIRDMTERDFQNLIDLALARYPEQGEVLDDHEEWFIRQAKLARQRFLGNG